MLEPDEGPDRGPNDRLSLRPVHAARSSHHRDANAVPTGPPGDGRRDNDRLRSGVERGQYGERGVGGVDVEDPDALRRDARRVEVPRRHDACGRLKREPRERAEIILVELALRCGGARRRRHRQERGGDAKTRPGCEVRPSEEDGAGADQHGSGGSNDRASSGRAPAEECLRGRATSTPRPHPEPRSRRESDDSVSAGSGARR